MATSRLTCATMAPPIQPTRIAKITSNGSKQLIKDFAPLPPGLRHGLQRPPEQDDHLANVLEHKCALLLARDWRPLSHPLDRYIKDSPAPTFRSRLILEQSK